MARRQARERRGHVVGEVEQEGNERCRLEATFRGEDLGRTKDQQGRRDVAHLEERDANQEPSEPSPEDRMDLESDCLALVGLETRQVPDCVDDRKCCEQARKDRYQDRSPDIE
jgi:hypothetical protein